MQRCWRRLYTDHAQPEQVWLSSLGKCRHCVLQIMRRSYTVLQIMYTVSHANLAALLQVACRSAMTATTCAWLERTAHTLDITALPGCLCFFWGLPLRMAKDIGQKATSKWQKAKGKRQEARGKRQEAKGKRQKAKGRRQKAKR